MSKASDAVAEMEANDVKVVDSETEIEEGESSEDTEQDTQSSEEEGTESVSTEEDTEEIVEEEENDPAPASKGRANARIRDLNERARLLEQQLQTSLTAQQQLQQMLAQNQQRADVIDEDDTLEPAVKARLEKIIEKERNQMQYALGGIMEQVDERDAQSDIPGYKSKYPNQETKVARDIRVFREEQSKANKYFKRYDAYQILVGTGKLKPVASTESAKPIRKKTQVVTEKKTNASVSKVSSQVDLKTLPLKERIAAYEKKYAGKSI